MPWTAQSGPYRHTHKATTKKRRNTWAKVANKVRSNRKYGRTIKQREAAATRIANFVVNRMAGGTGNGNYRKSIAKRRRSLHRAAPSRRSRFKHSVATRKKISIALKRYHRKQHSTRR